MYIFFHFFKIFTVSLFLLTTRVITYINVSMHALYFNTTVTLYDDKAQNTSVGYHTQYIYGKWSGIKTW